ncbi:MAG: transcriptional regulator [Chitinophagaceae bacterium]|nr:MAG: transcriptional regulator [Chitinophagaceae bacterium]
MTKIKESSTRNANKKTAIIACPVSYVMEKIGGHWKPVILYQLMSGAKRYSEIRRAIPNITEKMLIQHLKQLQEDDLVIRDASPVIPPVVYYRLSTAGKKLTPVLNSMAVWAIEDVKSRNRKELRYNP